MPQQRHSGRLSNRSAIADFRLLGAESPIPFTELGSACAAFCLYRSAIANPNELNYCLLESHLWARPYCLMPSQNNGKRWVHITWRQRQNVKVVGIDVSRGSIHACVLESLPADLLEYSRSYKPVKLGILDAPKLSELGDVFALEPTGSDHRVFVDVLRRSGKPILGVTGTRVRHFAKDSGILNKADREDAAVIAAYTLRHLIAKNPKAFISIESSEIRQNFLALLALKRQRTALINQIRARLVYELPELHAKKTDNRRWGCNNPPRLWRLIAGEEECRNAIQTSIGSGLSKLTRQLSAQVCSIERLEHSLEMECDSLYGGPDFDIYRPVFEHWGLSMNVAIAILAAVHPIEQFLEDGHRVRKRVYATSASSHTKTTRDRSLKQFKRAIGAGRQLIQSGKKEFYVPTGDPNIRKCIYIFLEMQCVIRRQPSRTKLRYRYPWLAETMASLNDRQQKKLIRDSYSFPVMCEKWTAEAGLGRSDLPWKSEAVIKACAEFTNSSHQIAKLQLFYELASQCQNKPKKQRLMKTYPRFVTWLFNDLINSVSNQTHTE